MMLRRSLVLALPLGFALATPATGSSPVHIVVESPAQGERIENRVDQAPVVDGDHRPV